MMRRQMRMLFAKLESRAGSEAPRGKSIHHQNIFARMIAG
jgi:hypothetical protein